MRRGSPYQVKPHFQNVLELVYLRYFVRPAGVRHCK